MMRRPFALSAPAAILGAALAAAPATAQEPRDLVLRAVNAMGGESALRGLNSIAADYYSATFGLRQSELPDCCRRGGPQPRCFLPATW